MDAVERPIMYADAVRGERREFVVQTSVESGQPVSPAGAPASSVNATEHLPWEAIARTGAGAVSVLTEALKQFWGVPVRLNFFSAGAKAHYFWKLDDFHVSQLVLGEPEPGEPEEARLALLRLSDATCSAFLTRALGPRNGGQKPFSFRQLSPLEANILNEFSKELLSCLMKTIIRKPGRHASQEQIHLMWVVQAQAPIEREGSAAHQKKSLQFRESFELGKIVLSLPLGTLRLESPHAVGAAPPIADEFFFPVAGPARIYLGRTRLTLADLNQLEMDDLVVLEDSHAEQMAIVEPESGEHLPFPATIRQKQRLTIPYTQELATMETQHQLSTRQSLWDNLMIEVTAEFDPIRLPLKQIKQMSEGLVVEMGDLIHNRICLQVEGKTLAWGDLIIVGDKFGIRINKVEADKEASAPSPEVTGGQALTMIGQTPDVQAVEQDMETPEAGESAEEENLDNFLNDDFDESFDDDEEAEW
jgi:flagellar motor switch/type III secretory pathway protein FliN